MLGKFHLTIAVVVTALALAAGTHSSLAAATLQDVSKTYDRDVQHSKDIVIDFRSGPKCAQCPQVEDLLASHADTHADLKVVKAGSDGVDVTAPYVFIWVPDYHQTFSVQLSGLTATNVDEFLNGIQALVKRAEPILYKQQDLGDREQANRKALDNVLLDIARTVEFTRMSSSEETKQHDEVDNASQRVRLLLTRTYNQAQAQIKASASTSQSLAIEWLNSDHLFTYALIASPELLDRIDSQAGTP